MQQTKISSKFQFGGKSLSITLKVVFFEEDNIFYAYLPSLDLTGYGNTDVEAKESLKVVLDEFLRYTLSKNGCKLTRTSGGHEHWTRADLFRPITIQSHIDPVPERVMKQILIACT